MARSLVGIKENLREVLAKRFHGLPAFPSSISSAKACIGYLCGDFIIEWAFLFSDTELEELYFPFFFHSPPTSTLPLQSPSDILQTLLSAISTQAEDRTPEIEELYKKQIVSLLQSWLDPKYAQIQSLFSHIVNHCSNQMPRDRNNSSGRFHNRKQEITCFLAIPTKLTNLLQLNTPCCFYPKAFIASTIQQSSRFLLQNQNDENSVALLFYIMGRLISLYPKQGDQIGKIVAHWWRSIPCARKGLSYVEKRSLSLLLYSTISNMSCAVPGVQRISNEIHISKDSDIDVLSQVLDESNEQTQNLMIDLLCRQFVSSKLFVLRPSLVTLLYSMYKSKCDISYLQETMLYAATTWGSRTFLHSSSLEKQEYISRIIVYVFQLYNERPEEITSWVKFREISENVMSGVQLRIGSPIPEYRRWGMLIGERYSIYFPTDTTLSFEYDPIIDEEEESKATIPYEEEKQVILPIKGNQEEVEGAIPVVRGFAVLDPNEIIRFDSEDDEMSSEDEDLMTYDMEDDLADLEKIAPPVYLADCLRLLRDTENPESLEAALKVLEMIILRKPDDLEEIILDITRSLLFLASSLPQDEFLNLRFKALVSCATTSPTTVVPYLTSEFYGENHNIQNRLDILRVLTQAAQIISGNDTSEEEIEPSSLQEEKEISPFEIVSDFVSDGFSRKAVGRIVKVREHPSHSLSKKIEMNSRRWGSLERRNAAKSKLHVNRFDALCGTFFFPLLKHFDNPENRFSLLGEDGMVLAQLLFTLAMFIECSSCSDISGQRMLVAMLDVNWFVRYHPEAFVRRSVLFSVCKVFTKLPKHIILAEMNEDCRKWKGFLEEVAETEPDDQARNLSFASLFTLKRAIDE